jgi:PAS domain S-box-containing protein
VTELPTADLGSQAAAWEQALVAAGDPLAAGEDLAKLARRLARVAASGLNSAVDAERAGHLIGRLLVQAHLTAPAAVQHTVVLLGQESSGLIDGERRIDAGHLARMQGGVAAGHAAAVQQLLLDQQEAIHRAAITARDGAERALRESEARFRTLFGQAPVGIGIGDVQGTIHEVNDALQRMLGYTLEEFRARRVEEFMHPDDATQIWDDYAALVAGKLDEFRTEKRYLHKDGGSSGPT